LRRFSLPIIKIKIFLNKLKIIINVYNNEQHVKAGEHGALEAGRSPGFAAPRPGLKRFNPQAGS
jgi:hypothetical protein